MSLDDLGRRAAHDLGRTSERLEPSLPTAGELVERGRRRRAVRSAAGLVAVLVVLVAGAAFAGSGSSGGTTDVASEGESTLPADELIATTATTEPDECEQARADAVADGGVNLFACLEACNAAAGAPSDCVPASSTSTSVASVPDSLEDGTTSLTSTLPPTTGTFPPDGGVVPPTPPPPGDDPPTTPHTPPPPPPSTTTTPPMTDASEMGYVRGTVTAGPMCPVESPADPCDDVGVEATVTFTMIREDAEFLFEPSITTGSNGTFLMSLPSGRYSVTTTSAAAMSCENTTVTVVKHNTVTLDITCDTGIR